MGCFHPSVVAEISRPAFPASLHAHLLHGSAVRVVCLFDSLWYLISFSAHLLLVSRIQITSKLTRNPNPTANLSAFPIEFQQVRGWSPVVASLPFLALLVGILIAGGLNVLNNKYYFRKFKQNGNKPVPEARLPPMMIGSVVFAMGLFLFAWTSSPSVHWIAPVIGSFSFHDLMLTVDTDETSCGICADLVVLACRLCVDWNWLLYDLPGFFELSVCITTPVQCLQDDDRTRATDTLFSRQRRHIHEIRRISNRREHVLTQRSRRSISALHRPVSSCYWC